MKEGGSYQSRIKEGQYQQDQRHPAFLPNGLVGRLSRNGMVEENAKRYYYDDRNPYEPLMIHHVSLYIFDDDIAKANGHPTGSNGSKQARPNQSQNRPHNERRRNLSMAGNKTNADETRTKCQKQKQTRILQPTDAIHITYVRQSLKG